jgi:3-methyladenine DNA glycosylase/8-oxoguanine DNA glycosylase
MPIQSLTLAAPPRFSFWHTIHSHGWSDLAPYAVDHDAHRLRRILTLADGTLVDCVLDAPAKRTIRVRMDAASTLTLPQRREAGAIVSACFRLEDDMTPFYHAATSLARYRWIPKLGAGRMLRAPSVFEDAVKMILTTNCNWSLTKSMTLNLTTALGRSLDGTLYSFPSPADIAGRSESFIRREIRVGYRSPYLLELAERVASGKLDIESWRAAPTPTPELFKQMRDVKGMGDYAVGNLLKLLGRYDYLALDSWVRAQYAELHHGGRRVSDRTIERAYERYGEWRGLFFWLEMTREWYETKFPF